MNNSVLINPDSMVSKHNFVLRTNCERRAGDAHMHNFASVWYLLAGKCIHKIGDNVYTQNPGSCVVVPSHVPHLTDTSSSVDTPVLLSISFKDEFLTSRGYNFCSYSDRRAIFERYRVLEFCEFSGDERITADNLARNMLSEFSGYSEAVLDKLAGMLADLFRLMCVECEESRLKETFIDSVNRVKTAIKFMEEHYMEKITLEDLCRLTALSHYGFTKKFKEITGLTAMDYLHRLRLWQAHQLLIFTELPLSKIAERVGFYDNARLVHAFIDHTGISPSAFRKEARPESYRQDFNARRGKDFLRKLAENSDI